jgi:hypothetical protein
MMSGFAATIAKHAAAQAAAEIGPDRLLSTNMKHKIATKIFLL